MGTDLSNHNDIHNFFSKLTTDLWVELPVSGPRPLSRYKHAAAVAEKHLYLVGGSCNGRYLCDVQVLDLINMSWSTVKPNRWISYENNEGVDMKDIPAISGHCVVKWETKLLIVGGHTKDFSNKLAVRFLDLISHDCGIVGTSGSIPDARGGHSVTLIGSRLFLFGGEDRHRLLLNDLFVLDLNTMIWDMVETRGIFPAPRFDHVAAVHTDRYFLIFGGCSHSIFFNDLHVLDLDSMEWSKPQCHGDIVNARAGHAGITIDEHWYMLGGGNNRSGDGMTLMLNMSKLTFSVITSVEGPHPLASEGLSLCSAVACGENVLIAFGGYNGKYYNEVFVMKPRTRALSPPRMFQSQSAAAAAASVAAAYAIGGLGDRSRPPSVPNLTAEIALIRDGNVELESALASAQMANSLTRGKIGEKATYSAYLTKELQSVRAQLVLEKKRCSNLEVEIDEVEKMLEKLALMKAEARELQSWRSEVEKRAAEGRRWSVIWPFSGKGE